MCGLGLLRRLNNIKVMLILPTGIRVLSRVQDLLLSLQLLLQHYLSLLLIGAGASILQGLGVASGAPLAICFVNCSRSAAVVLGRFVANHLLLQLQDVARLGRRRHRQRSTVL